MKPFLITEHCSRLVANYPEATLLLAIARVMSREERECFVRLWIAEGIPYAFRNAPMLYESVRGWLAKLIGISPKVVTIVGSARIGYSLSPHPKYGYPFGFNSDLDFAMVSEHVFTDLSCTFHRWKEDVEEGRVHPRHEKERKYWQDNLSRLPCNLARGFVDPHKIPSWHRYPIAMKIANVMWRLSKKLAATPSAPEVKTISIRVYRDWDAFLAQMGLNFWWMLKSFNSN